MGIKLSEIEPNTRIIFHIYNGDSQMDLGGFLKKHLKENLALITLDYTGKQKLVFDNVRLDLEYPQGTGLPIMWSDIKILNYKNAYILQVTTDGEQNNRRSSFRVPVSKKAWFTMEGRDPQYVMIKDISVSGFSIADRKKNMNLPMESLLNVKFDDSGFHLDLDGRVVRIEERDDMIIYGMSITNLCRDVSAYINSKQRPSKK